MTDIELAIMIKNTVRETVRKMTATAKNATISKKEIMDSYKAWKNHVDIPGDKNYNTLRKIFNEFEKDTSETLQQYIDRVYIRVN